MTNKWMVFALATSFMLGVLCLGGNGLMQGAVSQQRVTAASMVKDGMNTTVFQTPQGSLNVNFPDDMAAEDTLSGTVIAEPAGRSKQEKAEAEDELNGYVVEIKKAEIPAQPVSYTPEQPHAKPEKKPPKKPACPLAKPTDPGFICKLPKNNPCMNLVLKDPKGKKVCSTKVPYPPKPPPSSLVPPNTCNLPQVGQCGKPVKVKMPCNPDFNSGNVKIGGQPCQPLAKSPRGVVVETPRGVVGKSDIEVNEGNKTAQGVFHNLKVKLSAPKTVLKKGESTTVTVQVFGLEGVTQPVTLTIENKSPGVVNMEGGNQQTITINPGRRI